MNNQDLARLLDTATDPWELLDAAKALAKDTDLQGHRALAQAICSSHFLQRLDTPEDYEDSSLNLRLMSLMQTLAENPVPSAVAVLTAANDSVAYHDHPSRTDVLIDAWASIRPSPPPAIQLWDRYSQMDDGFNERTLLRISENGSPPALNLLEQKLINPEYEAEERRYWSRRHGIPDRDNPIMLEAYSRMWAGSIEPELRITVIEILFDYQPKSWYSPHDVPALPDRQTASNEALQRLAHIGTAARTHPGLSESLVIKIDAELERINKILNLSEKER